MMTLVAPNFHICAPYLLNNSYLQRIKAADSGGNVLVGGYITSGGSLFASAAGSYDCWFGKYSSLGEQIWAVQLGTSSIDVLTSIVSSSQKV